jgi:hypothetical protein
LIERSAIESAVCVEPVTALKTRNGGLQVAIIDMVFPAIGNGKITEQLQALHEKWQCGMGIAEPDTL